MPPKMPPKMMTGIKSAQMLFLNTVAICLPDIFSCAGSLFFLPKNRQYTARDSAKMMPGKTEPINSFETETLVMLA